MSAVAVTQTKGIDHLKTCLQIVAEADAAWSSRPPGVFSTKLRTLRILFARAVDFCNAADMSEVISMLVPNMEILCKSPTYLRLPPAKEPALNDASWQEQKKRYKHACVI